MSSPLPTHRILSYISEIHRTEFWSGFLASMTWALASGLEGFPRAYRTRDQYLKIVPSRDGKGVQTQVMDKGTWNKGVRW